MSVEQHAALFLNGADWSDVTIHSLAITGGRASAFAAADVATVGVSIVMPVGRPLPMIGDTVQISGWLGADEVGHTSQGLFWGAVTDVAFEPGTGPNGEAVVSITAADKMRQLDGLPVGDVPWDNEQWYVRVERVWFAAAGILGSPSWMVPEITAGAGAPFHSLYLVSRDVDSQPALQLLQEYFGPHGHAVYYRPMSGQFVNDDPAYWSDGSGYVNLFDLPAAAVLAIPARLIEKVGPRYWMNLSGLGNHVIIRGKDWDEVASDWVDVEFRADGGDPTRHGHKTKSFSTEIDARSQDVGALADAWLARTERPAYMLDGVTVHFDDVADRDLWKTLANRGPAQCGVLVDIETLAGSDGTPGRPGWYQWVIEGTTWTLTDTGWIVDLRLSPASVYRGTIPITPDPRSNWGDVAAFHTSWDDLVAAHPTWDDLVATPHPHPAEARAA